MADLSPTEWFDQFPDAPGWQHPQWCARHWAPAAILGANGLGASVELMQMFINEISTGGTPQAMQSQMDAAGHVCCALGDERMYELWGHWPPATSEVPDGR